INAESSTPPGYMGCRERRRRTARSRSISPATPGIPPPPLRPGTVHHPIPVLSPKSQALFLSFPAMTLLDPIVLFFLLGLVAGLLRSELRLPPAIYEFLSVLLLIAIGLK